MYNEWVTAGDVVLSSNILETVKEYVYLGQVTNERMCTSQKCTAESKGDRGLSGWQELNSYKI